MRNEDKDFFTLVNDILGAIERKEYRAEIIPDRRHEDKAAFLVETQNFATEDLRYLEAGKMVSTLFMGQLSATQRAQVPAQFDFAVTRYNGGAYFYFKTPDNFKLDFPRARKELDRVKGMFTPHTLGAIDLGPYRENETQICVGPMPKTADGYFKNVMLCLLTFHGVEEIDSQSVSTDVGLFLIFDKDQYKNVLRNAEMLAQCPMYQSTTSPPPPAPPAAFS